MDLEGDAELESLRLAALATLKSRAAKKEEPDETSQVDNISKVSTVITSKAFDQSTYAKKDSNDKIRGSTHNQHSWRNSSQPRGRGRGKQYPKINQRSNLIVITPVSLNEKKPSIKEPSPQLMLPQLKWCQSANEDSSSPKSFRKTGPMRFNRHRSRSGSSDSDYENSDNDSYSNETILQDEPSGKFNRLIPEDNTEEDSVQEPQRISDRRLSFQNINSSLALDNLSQKEPEDSFNSSQNTYLTCSGVNQKISRAMSRENEPDPKKSYTNFDQYTHSSVDDKHSFRGRECSPFQSDRNQNASNINGRSFSKKDYLPGNRVSVEKDNRHLRKYPEKPLENISYNNSTERSIKNHADNLSEGDLRFELKKRLQKSKSENIHSSQSQYESFDHHSHEQIRNNFHQKHSRSTECKEAHNYAHRKNSRENRTHNRKNRSQSSSPNNHSHSASPVRNNFDQSQEAHSQIDPYYKRERSSNSSERSYKRSRNQSPDRRNTAQNLSRERRCSGSSSSSTSSSSYSSNSSNSAKQQIRSVPSVVKPVSRMVDLKPRNSVNLTEKFRAPSAELDSVIGSKRGRDLDEKCKIASTAVKPSGYGPENRNHDGNKRVPVHMRLGTLPNKRVIKMPKDVEAAFVNTSSDDETDVIVRCDLVAGTSFPVMIFCYR
ncbi:uncharacterized protein NPIL_80751 [Nephila pilipes]|uniref:Uncharacterized protein n=1 Tax=Nephila pilipes TaxID=299642 RepID=A0A8X6IF65_NEPPI|nr:uncharacterized protein NPIL_80751 [Nephila pilipes]